MGMAVLVRTVTTKRASLSSTLSRFSLSTSLSITYRSIFSSSVSTLRLRQLLLLSSFRAFPWCVNLKCFSTAFSRKCQVREANKASLRFGCDSKHWLVLMNIPDENLSREEMINSYIETLAMVVGSEEEARQKIYSVSTKHYYAFGCLVSEKLSNKIKGLPNVKSVLIDSYIDVKSKDYGGEPFVNGQAVPYDPKYHEVVVRNKALTEEELASWWNEWCQNRYLEFSEGYCSDDMCSCSEDECEDDYLTCDESSENEELLEHK